MEDGSLQHRPRQSAGFKGRSHHGMECVVATVSGYHGSERFNLIKLISQTGASYVGAMSKSTTHLICWKFEGKKYTLARKFKTEIVNHRWIEDCIKAGKRIPVHPYILQSGEEVGPLSLEVPVAAKKDKDKVISCQFSAHDQSKISATDLGCGAQQSIQIDSCLLNEDYFPDLEANKLDFVKVKKNRVRKTLKQDCFSRDRHSNQELPLSELVRAEKRAESSRLSEHLVRQKRNICDDLQETTLHIPSRKGRRLVKKTARKGILDCMLSDSEQEGIPLGLPQTHDSFRAFDSVRNENVCEIQGARTNNGFYEGGASGNDLESDNLDAHMKDDSGRPKDITKLPASTELSCVICWTDFSSVRGILPCGHRFCYSCIESWADHLASRRKVSACPLCKASFFSITKVDDVSSLDQKIYSQTIPDAPLKRDILVLHDAEIRNFRPQASLPPICCECQCREPVDLLINCHLCQIQCVHSYCLDPPLFPWTCVHCRDLRMHYPHIF